MYRLWFGLLVAMLFLNGCTTNKKIDELHDLIKKLDLRIEALEKLVLPQKEEAPKQQSAYNIPIGDSHVLGKPDAPIHIVVFSNFQCPYCAHADKMLRDLVKDPQMKDKINVVFKHFPFERMPEARNASKAAMAAGEPMAPGKPGKFWEMSEKIFTHQDKLSAKNYEKWAKEIGLNVEKFKKDLKDNDKKYDDMINADIKAISGKEAEEAGVKLQGTPWILVGGWLLRDEITPAGINKVIAEKKL